MRYGWLIDERMTLRQILKRLAASPWRPRCVKRPRAKSVVHPPFSGSFRCDKKYCDRDALMELGLGLGGYGHFSREAARGLIHSDASNAVSITGGAVQVRHGAHRLDGASMQGRKVKC